MKKNRILGLIPTIIPIVCTIVSYFVLVNTLNFKLNNFSSKIYDNKTLIGGTYNYNYLSISNKIDDKNSTYSDLFNKYYYNLNVGEARILFSNSFLDGENNNLKIYTQDTFSIDNQYLPGGGHYLDYGIFATYFADDILGPRNYLNIRNGCDTFIYISDSYADKLLEKYNISSYEELIKNDAYNTLEMKVDGADKCKFCINNILYSNKRHGVRAKFLYGDFAVAYNSSKTKSILSRKIELDLKANNFCNINLFKDLYFSNYTNKNFDFNFFKYNLDKGCYLLSENLNIEFNTFDYQKDDYLARTVFLSLCFLDIALTSIFYVLTKNKVQRDWCFYSYFFSFLVFGIIANFCLVYYLMSIIALISLVLIALFGRKEVANDFRFIFIKIFKIKNYQTLEKHYIIEI